nr:putative F-box protein At4g09190 [Ipomoea trifida]
MSSSKMRLSASDLPFSFTRDPLPNSDQTPCQISGCDSKFFYSVVDDHPFADLHLNWSLTLPSRISILIFFPPRPDGVNTSDYYTMNYSEENQGKLQANRLRYLDDRSQKVDLCSAVNDLLCFCSYDDIEIHNLSTRRHISLPTTCPDLRRDSRSRMNACGLLGFDPISRRYKVLKSVQLTDHEDRHVSTKHWVFTLGLDQSLRKVHSSPSFHPYNCFKTHSYFCTSVRIGVIYSLNSSRFDIVAFDVRTENFKAIPPPPFRNAVSPGLIEVDSRLAILQPRHPENRSMGRLELVFQYGVWRNLWYGKNNTLFALRDNTSIMKICSSPQIVLRGRLVY